MRRGWGRRQKGRETPFPWFGGKKIYGEVEVGWEKTETSSFFLERKRNEALVVISAS